MSSLTKEGLIVALKKLSEFMSGDSPELEQIINSAQHRNAWFTPVEVRKSLTSLCEMLNENDLEAWLADVSLNARPKTVGLILAGNIPLVGFHDVLCVLVAGNKAMIKMSSSDDKLLPAILRKLVSSEPSLADRIEYQERLSGFEAIIATGSNNTSRYFEYYFGKVPHIIRKNRNSVAVLTGNESTEDLASLGHDIFDYFGLGCRNVSKLYLPKGYHVNHFFESIERYKPIIDHFKYNNNYDYNKSIYLINAAKHFDNGFLLLKEDDNLVSPLAVLFYEEYTDIKEVEKKLTDLDEQIQCVISGTALNIDKQELGFGKSQSPKLWDYADNVDTIAFLKGL